METSYCCPDCGDEHRNPAEATLGREVRCLDCQIEIDLALEFKALPIPQIAA
jgi:DNA-directed RNA polymerase subunit RPC12/RpoP